MLRMQPPGRIRRGDQPRAPNRRLQVDVEEHVELALVRPRPRLPGEHVGAGVVDPHVDVLERAERVANDRGAAVERAEVRLEQRMGPGPSSPARASAASAERQKPMPTRGAGGGERDRDRPADPGAGSGDDGAQTGERQLSGLRGQLLRR